MTSLSAAGEQLYFAQPATWVLITKVTFFNSDANVSHNVSLQIFSQGVGYTVTRARPVLGGDTWNSPNEYGLVLNPGDSLWGFADVGAVVNLFVTGQIFGG